MQLLCRDLISNLQCYGVGWRFIGKLNISCFLLSLLSISDQDKHFFCIFFRDLNNSEKMHIFIFRLSSSDWSMGGTSGNQGAETRLRAHCAQNLSQWQRRLGRCLHQQDNQNKCEWNTDRVWGRGQWNWSTVCQQSSCSGTLFSMPMIIYTG